jgi:hypothetical protein
MGHIPLIDHNPGGGEKVEFEPVDAIRYKERRQAERHRGWLKEDEFGERNALACGPYKVMSHLMFGMLALTAD